MASANGRTMSANGKIIQIQNPNAIPHAHASRHADKWPNEQDAVACNTSFVCHQVQLAG